LLVVVELLVELEELLVELEELLVDAPATMHADWQVT
jgi:hypothetical protein